MDSSSPLPDHPRNLFDHSASAEHGRKILEDLRRAYAALDSITPGIELALIRRGLRHENRASQEHCCKCLFQSLKRSFTPAFRFLTSQYDQQGQLPISGDSDLRYKLRFAANFLGTFSDGDPISFQAQEAIDLARSLLSSLRLWERAWFISPVPPCNVEPHTHLSEMAEFLQAYLNASEQWDFKFPESFLIRVADEIVFACGGQDLWDRNMCPAKWREGELVLPQQIALKLSDCDATNDKVPKTITSEDSLEGLEYEGLELRGELLGLAEKKLKDLPKKLVIFLLEHDCKKSYEDIASELYGPDEIYSSGALRQIKKRANKIMRALAFPCEIFSPERWHMQARILGGPKKN